ncbi:MAG: type IV toxin-antitoxin system AbiEi family antitoxin, partial [Firmicutes bacterium]|nr:type IV toxin-antitoxin system AbiEi family antitoxin [Bacillota bacterium]
HMLKHPARFFRIQELTAEAHCSQGQIAKIKDFLHRNNLLEEGENGFRISDAIELLKKWAFEYQKTKDEVVKFFSTKDFSSLEEDIAKYFYALEEDNQYSFCGYTASNIYYHGIRNNKMTLYVSRRWIESLSNQIGLKKVDKGANVEITIPYAQVVLDDSILKQGKRVASRAQICLELYGTGGRSEEALDPLFREFSEHGK